MRRKKGSLNGGAITINFAVDWMHLNCNCHWIYVFFKQKNYRVAHLLRASPCGECRKIIQYILTTNAHHCPTYFTAIL